MSSERAPRSPGGEAGRGPGAGAPAGGSAAGTAARVGRNPNPHPGIGRLGWMVRGRQGPGRSGYPVPGSGSGGARAGRRIERSGRARLRSCGRDSAGSVQASGMPDDIIQKGKDIKGVSEIVQNGKHFKFTITAGSKVIQNEFTLGEECEMEFMTGEKIKAVVQLEGDNKLVTTFKGIKSVTEFNGDTVTSTMTKGDIVFKRVSKRI